MSNEHEARLLEHLIGIPDAKEVFGLLELLRQMDAITSEEATHLMSRYWEVG